MVPCPPFRPPSVCCRASQERHPMASWPRPARVGYRHGGRLALLVVWGLLDSLRESQQWRVPLIFVTFVRVIFLVFIHQSLDCLACTGQSRIVFFFVGLIDTCVPCFVRTHIPS